MPSIRKPETSTIAHAILIALAAFLVYSNTFIAPMTFDDDSYIINNMALRDWGTFKTLQLKNLPEFTKNFTVLFRNRPLPFLTFALNYRMGGLDPAGYHMVNLLIHIAAGLTLYWLTILLMQTPGLRQDDRQIAHMTALIASLLFVCHPLQTQAITFISQRFASMATLFYLGALALYIKSRLTESSRESFLLYVGATFFVLLAVRSKEISFTMPLALVLLEVMCFGGLRGLKPSRVAPWLAIAFIIPATLFFHQGSLNAREAIAATDSGTISSLDYFLTQQRVIVTYLRLLVLPISQNLDYDYPVYHSIFHAAVIGSILLHAALLGLATYLFILSRSDGRAHWRWASFGIFWFYLTLSVESSILPLGDIIFEHRMYLPLAGVSVSIAALGAHWAYGTKQKWALLACSACIIIALGATAYARNAVWSDPIRLWTDNVEKSPKKARSHANLGREYIKLGMVDKTIEALNASLAIDPSDETIHYALAWAYNRKGMPTAAIQQYNESIKLKPSAAAYNNLGNIFFKQRLYGEAVSALANAVAIDGTNPSIHNNLGLAYSSFQKNDLAVQSYRQAIALDPAYAQARFNLVTKLIEMGERDAAQKELEELQRVNPELAKRVRARSGP